MLPLSFAADPDPRVTCQTCRHYRPNQCGNHKAAGLYRPDVAPAFAELRQWCHGFSALPAQEPEGMHRVRRSV